MTRDELISLAKYYIEYDISLAKLAEMHGMTKITLIRYFQGKCKVTLPSDLQDAVDSKKSKNWIDGKSTYGNRGNVSFTKEQLISIANLIIDEGYTLTEVAKAKNVSAATLHNLLIPQNIGEELYLKLKATYRENKAEKFKSSRKKGI